MLDKLASPFEGECDPRPLALFRIAFYAGLLLHFGPALLNLEQNYSAGAFRTRWWNHTLHDLLPRLPPTLVAALAALTLAACASGLVGFRPRVSAAVAGLGLYTFASFNGLHVQTLALCGAWAVLTLWAIGGGGTEVWSLDARLAGGPRPGRRLVRNLVLAQLLIGFFFAGVEKVLAGWPMDNDMYVLFNYPPRTMLRDAFVPDWLRTETAGYAMSTATVGVELLVPPLLMVRATRLWALLAYELFFVSIVLFIEVPPLFFVVYAFGGLLVLDDATLRRAARA